MHDLGFQLWRFLLGQFRFWFTIGFSIRLVSNVGLYLLQLGVWYLLVVSGFGWGHALVLFVVSSFGFGFIVGASGFGLVSGF